MLSVHFFFFSSRRRHTRCLSDWSSDVCSSDLDARGFDDAGLADGGSLAGGGIHQGELRGGVILEEIFVVRVLQHVLVGDYGRRAAEAFLDVRPGGHEGFGGGGAAV